MAYDAEVTKIGALSLNFFKVRKAVAESWVYFEKNVFGEDSEEEEEVEARWLCLYDTYNR